MAWRALVAQPVGVTQEGRYSIVVQYYDDADAANTNAGLGPSGNGTANASTDLVTITGHGLAAGDQVVFTALTGGAGLTLNVPYRVLAAGLTSNAFAVSQSPNGPTVDISTNATALTARKFTPPVNVLWSEAFDMALTSSTQDLIDEVTRKGQIARSWVQSRDSARSSVPIGSTTVIS